MTRGSTPIDEKSMTTRDGARLEVRPIRADDKEALVDAFEHLSDESRYRRFLRPLKHLASDDLAYFTELDHRDHEALVAVGDQDELVGVARYIRLADRPGVAEVAVTVVDEWQGRGVGTTLLERLARRARSAGIRSFEGICLANNQEMLQLLTELGPTERKERVEPNVFEVEVGLPTDSPSHDFTTALRKAARTHAALPPR
jgi:GNAT superfamily N-acetyltransferase